MSQNGVVAMNSVSGAINPSPMSTTAANVSRPGDVSRNDMVRFGYSRAGARRSA